MALIVVSNTSPLSSLATIEQLSLLREIYKKVIIPQAVAEELSNVGDADQKIKDTLLLDWIEVRQANDLAMSAMLQKDRLLDRGEAEAIALALELDADALLIDERLGRREATRLGLSIVGVLGILLVAKRRNLIPEIRSTVDSLISKAGFRVSEQLYQEVLNAAGE